MTSDLSPTMRDYLAEVYRLSEQHGSDDQYVSTSALADRDQLERGFRRLSIDHRAVVVLHHYLDWPLDRVADALGMRSVFIHPLDQLVTKIDQLLLHRRHICCHGWRKIILKPEK